ncbi:MAG: S41 family peptidase, partial [Planctomycetia bacterium]|nr:S41 family peptidase [Planctomycetia bacterium]
RKTVSRWISVPLSVPEISQLVTRSERIRLMVAWLRRWWTKGQEDRTVNDSSPRSPRKFSILRISSGVLAGSALIMAVVSGHFAEGAESGPVVGVGVVAGTDRDEIAVPPEEIRDVLERGARLELQRSWTDALNLYEEALHRWPKEPDIRECFYRCRCHHELARRYADPSFREQLQTSTPMSALRICEEVLSRISLYYVEAPAWNEIFARGAQAFDFSLEDETFLKVWPQVTSEQVAQFRKNRGAWMRGLPLTRVSEVVVAVRQLGDLVERTLRIPMQAMVFEFIAGTVSMLDPYSAYLTPNQLRDLFGQIDGNFVGIGVELRIFGNRLVVTRVLPDSPAQRGGVLVGDRLVSVDGNRWNEVTIEQLASRLQGRQGSVVQIEVDRGDDMEKVGNIGTSGNVSDSGSGNLADTVRSLTLRRERVDVPSIEDVRFIDSAQGIACLRLTGFQRTTRRELEDALWSLYHEGMRSLVIDVRGNPGGLLPASVDAADLFVKEGPIVSTRGRNPAEDAIYNARGENTWRVPLIVLIDENSASASEIFAGAIHEHGRGTIVGTRSYGKGSVQSVVPLVSTDAGLRLTTARFYSPGGSAYQDTGVSPDVFVHAAARPVGATRENVSGASGPQNLNTSSPERVPLHTDPVIVAAIECLTRHQRPEQTATQISSARGAAMSP